MSKQPDEVSTASCSDSVLFTESEEKDTHELTDTSSVMALPGNRQRPMREESRPGAYAFGGLAIFANLPSLRPPTRDTSTNRAAASLESGLAQAVLVTEEPTTALSEARPIDVLAQARRRRQDRAKTKRLVAGFLLTFALIVTLIGTVAVFSGKERSVLSSDSTIPGQPSPTTAPSTAPSEAPTAVLDSFVTTLPDYTIESLKDPFSPQTLAYRWLSSHQDITSMPQWRKMQLFAIATVFYSLGGPYWPKPIRDTWLVDSRSECDWFSSGYGYFDLVSGNWVELKDFEAWFPCDAEGHYVQLNLGWVDFSGSTERPTIIPPEITLLKSLNSLVCHNNKLNGTIDDLIPSRLYSMTTLKALVLSFNSLTGTIPTQLVSIMTLQHLDLRANLLTGTLPSEILSLDNLEYLDVSQTYMSGTIPTNIDLLSNLESLYLFSGLTGPIPSEIGRLSHLQRLLAAYTSLTGTIPTEIAQLSDTLLMLVFSESTSLSGALPTELTLLTKLEYLSLGNTDLSGVLPSEFGLLTNLLGLKVRQNLLAGPIPTELGLLTSLTYLSLEGNEWSGAIPTEIGLLTSLEKLGLAETTLTGSLPTELALLSNLTYFDVSGINLTGTIPESFCSLQDADCVSNLFTDLFYGKHGCLVQFDCSSYLCGCGCSCG